MISGPGMYGWFEPLPQLIHWLKEIKTVYSEQEANVKCVFVQPGCVSIIISHLTLEIIMKFKNIQL